MCGRYLTPNEQALERVFHVGRHTWQGLIPAWWQQDTLPTLSFTARNEAQDLIDAI